MSQPNTIKKHPTEVLNVHFDFTNRLDTGETITSATAQVVQSGNPTITVGTVTHTSTVVSVPLSAGTDGETDSFLVDATTSAAEVLAAVLKVAVSATDF